MLSRTCLPAVAEHRVRLAGHRAPHQVGEEPVQLRPGVVGAGQAAAAEADGRHVEVAAVLLHQQVGGRLRDAEQRVGGAVDRHRRVDAAVVAVVLRQLQPRLELHQRQPVGRVAVDLVGRGEDEGRVGAVLARRLEQVERAVGVDAEVGLRVARGPVVRGLRGGVDDQLDLAGVLGEDARDAVGVADVELERRGTRRARRTSRSVTCEVEASGPKNCARMSFSSPITS